MKKILFFDTETTGVYIPGAPIEEQPHMLQLGALFGKFLEAHELGDGEVIPIPDGSDEKINELFNPGVLIPLGSTEIHGITQEMIQNKDRFFWYANKFAQLINRADIIVGHNVDFDFKILSTEYRRIAAETNWDGVDAFLKMFESKLSCTMQSSIQFCQIPGRYRGYKWPKLSELHIKLFGVDFDGAHDAFADIVATKNCYFELRKKKLL
ncbi:3'-5' exonuclease [Candidatus Gracilibacteria bacterium]|nr:3'-5' exonuclease [Candidatus Gracilibacteria bacterium]